MSLLEVVCAIIMVAGLVGVVIQVIPGTVLVLAGVLLWATEQQTVLAWVILGFTVLVLGATAVIKYVLAGRSLKKAEVPNRSLLLGGVAGIIGFFVIPVVGLPLLFVLGVYVAEQVRLKDRSRAWASTKAAIKATGVTILIELAGAMIVFGAWLIAVLTSPGS